MAYVIADPCINVKDRSRPLAATYVCRCRASWLTCRPAACWRLDRAVPHDVEAIENGAYALTMAMPERTVARRTHNGAAAHVPLVEDLAWPR